MLSDGLSIKDYYERLDIFTNICSNANKCVFFLSLQHFVDLIEVNVTSATMVSALVQTGQFILNLIFVNLCLISNHWIFCIIQLER